MVGEFSLSDSKMGKLRGREEVLGARKVGVPARGEPGVLFPGRISSLSEQKLTCLAPL